VVNVPIILDVSIPYKSLHQKTKVYRLLDWICGSVCSPDEFKLITKGNFRGYGNRKNIYKIRLKGNERGFSEVFDNIYKLLQGNNPDAHIILDKTKRQTALRILSSIGGVLPDVELMVEFEDITNKK